MAGFKITLLERIFYPCLGKNKAKKLKEFEFAKNFMKKELKITHVIKQLRTYDFMFSLILQKDHIFAAKNYMKRKGTQDLSSKSVNQYMMEPNVLVS